MRLQFDPRQTAGAGEAKDRLFLASSHVRCIGGERDESVVARAAELLA